MNGWTRNDFFRIACLGQRFIDTFSAEKYVDGGLGETSVSCSKSAPNDIVPSSSRHDGPWGYGGELARLTRAGPGCTVVGFRV